MTASKQPAHLGRVTVVVVTFHSAQRMPALGPCLRDFPCVTVVDNASHDDTASAVRQHLPQATLLINDRNLGFGAANNRAVRAAQTDFVLLLNPDTLITPGSVAQLLDAADRHPDASMVAPQLLDRQGKPDISYSWLPGSWPGQGPGADGETCIGFASGACMLIRKTAMDKIGGFDEDFFLYYEDSDLCIRLVKACGPIILAPQVQVTHLNRSSSGGKARLKAEYLRGYHHIQSKFLFARKHGRESFTLARQLRYLLLATLELPIRLILLDLVRAARVAGRVAGAMRLPRIE